MSLSPKLCQSQRIKTNHSKSSTSSAASSSTAKWTPRGICVQCSIRKWRSTHVCGGVIPGTSLGKWANATGTSMCCPRLRLLHAPVPVGVANRSMHRFGHPVNHRAGEQFIFAEASLNVLIAVALRAELLHDPASQANRRVISTVGEGLLP